jgi:N-acylneuraminate cytidylyltransferase
MLVWTVLAALGCDAIDEVVVSTDDREIEAAALAAGASSLGLRQAVADDDSPSSLVSNYELERFVHATGREVETVVQLLPTCPLRTSRWVTELLKAHRDAPQRPRLSAHSPVGGNPWWSATLATDGTPEFHHPKALSQRSQDLPEVVVPNGGVWAISASQLREYSTFYSPGFVLHEIPWIAGFDIDTPAELELARLLAPAVLNHPA